VKANATQVFLAVGGFQKDMAADGLSHQHILHYALHFRRKRKEMSLVILSGIERCARELNIKFSRKSKSKI
jgi:hypothetical protein